MKINIHILILFLFLPVIAFCLPYEFPDSLKSDEAFSPLDTNSKNIPLSTDPVSFKKSLNYNVTRVANGLIDADGELNE